MDPWKSWAIVGIAAAGAAYYYSQSGKSQRGRRRASVVPGGQSQRRRSIQTNDSKAKRKKKDKVSDASDQPGSDAADVTSASGRAGPNGKLGKQKHRKQKASKLAETPAPQLSQEQNANLADDNAEDEGMTNAEFARQLSDVKTGNALKEPASTKETKELRKQGKRNKAPPESTSGASSKTNGVASFQDLSTTASSTTGADADDDLSPAISPKFGATQTAKPSGADVSDMLEPAPEGPSVLRLVEPTNSQPARQPKSQKPKQEPQTKKQRQNRQRNEEKKIVREQTEKERRILLEKQLQSAREAEGKPAKKGLAGSQAPFDNVWNKPAGAAASPMVTPTIPNNAPLLDTFDENKLIPGPGKRDMDGKVNGMSAEEKAWNQDLPPEEEQLRLITEMDTDNAWSTVPKGGKGKKKASGPTISSGSQKKDSPNGTKPPLATSENNSKTDSTTHNIQSYRSSTTSAVTADHEKNMSSNNKNKDASGDMKEANRDNAGIAAGSNAKDGKGEEYAGNLSAASNSHDSSKEKDASKISVSNAGGTHQENAATAKDEGQEQPKRVKETYKTLDHWVWNFDNIKEHPDYDPDCKYIIYNHAFDGS